MNRSRQDMIIEYLQEHGQATNQDIAGLMGINSKLAYDVYRRMIGSRILQRLPGKKLTFGLAPGWDETRRQKRGGRTITGRDAIKWYLARHERVTVSECAKAVGITENAVSVAATKMVSAGELVLDERVWKTNYYRLPDPANRGINTIFDECRQNWQGYRIHKIFSGVRA